MINRREITFAAISGLIALVAVFAMPLVVAKPKLLFGRSLSAISPTLFPYIILTIIVVLSVGLIAISTRQLIARRGQPGSSSQATESPENNWFRKTVFFVVLTGYGLMLKPLGFLISSFLVISATSLLLGNRNWLQISFLAILGPACLYLIATRAMLVSLPELNQIELFYARLITWLGGMMAQ